MKPWLVAGSIVALHLVMRALGLAAHMSVISGMPVHATSWAIAPIYLVVYLLAVTLAPVLAIAGLLHMAARLR